MHLQFRSKLWQWVHTSAPSLILHHFLWPSVLCTIEMKEGRKGGRKEEREEERKNKIRILSMSLLKFTFKKTLVQK